MNILSALQHLITAVTAVLTFLTGTAVYTAPVQQDSTATTTLEATSTDTTPGAQPAPTGLVAPHTSIQDATLRAAIQALASSTEELQKAETAASSAPTQVTPANTPAPAAAAPAPSMPIVIDTSVLTGRYKQFFPKGLHGTVDLWADQLVRQNGMDIAAGSDITYSIDGTVLGSPDGILGDYTFPLDTAKYDNGQHTIGIAADNGNGNTANASLTIDVEN